MTVFRPNVVLRLLSKELREIVRDRRALLFGLVLPLLVVPIALAGAALGPRLLMRAQDASQRRVLLWGKLPGEVGAALAASGWVVTSRDQVPADPGAAFRAVFEAGEAQVALAAADPASLYFNPASPESAIAARGVESALQSARLQLTRVTLTEHGLSADLAEPLRWTRHEVTLPLSLAVRFLPAILLLLLGVACLHVALETLAGERERGTLQTLL